MAMDRVTTILASAARRVFFIVLILWGYMLICFREASLICFPFDKFILACLTANNCDADHINRFFYFSRSSLT